MRMICRLIPVTTVAVLLISLFTGGCAWLSAPLCTGYVPRPDLGATLEEQRVYTHCLAEASREFMRHNGAGFPDCRRFFDACMNRYQ